MLNENLSLINKVVSMYVLSNIQFVPTKQQNTD